MKSYFFSMLVAIVTFYQSVGQENISNTDSQTTSEIGRYKVVDTGQWKCFDNRNEIEAPGINDSFYGQDAQFEGYQPSYTNNGDGTITDNVTGLTWQKAFEVMTYEVAVEKVKTFHLGMHSGWRIPTIKEAYSLIQFSGIDVSSPNMNSLPKRAKPFIDTTYYDFKYGSNGTRVIDVQLLSSTIYQGTTMGGAKTVFGVNLADGRIKGYPVSGPGGKKYYTVRYVCGNTEYGKNNFSNNNDGTISDLATKGHELGRGIAFCC